MSIKPDELLESFQKRLTEIQADTIACRQKFDSSITAIHTKLVLEKAKWRVEDQLLRAELDRISRGGAITPKNTIPENKSEEVKSSSTHLQSKFRLIVSVRPTTSS